MDFKDLLEKKAKEQHGKEIDPNKMEAKVSKKNQQKILKVTNKLTVTKLLKTT